MKQRADDTRYVRGHSVVITGAAGAIGQGIARLLVERGARVVLGDTRSDVVHEVAEDLGGSSIALAVYCDMTDQSDVAGLIDTAVSNFGRLDVLINVAGITHVHELAELPVGEWRRVFAVNAEGPLIASQHAVRKMLSQDVLEDTLRRGAIINIGSQGAEFPIPTSVAYGASKAALKYLSKTFAAAYKDRAISTSLIYPGMVYEGMWRQVNEQRTRALNQDFSQVTQEHLAETPTGRFQEPGELAEVVLYAAHFKGMWLNGQTIWSEAHPEW